MRLLQDGGTFSHTAQPRRPCVLQPEAIATAGTPDYISAASPARSTHDALAVSSLRQWRNREVEKKETGRIEEGKSVRQRCFTASNPLRHFAVSDVAGNTLFKSRHLRRRLQSRGDPQLAQARGAHGGRGNRPERGPYGHWRCSSRRGGNRTTPNRRSAQAPTATLVERTHSSARWWRPSPGRRTATPDEGLHRWSS